MLQNTLNSKLSRPLYVETRAAQWQSIASFVDNSFTINKLSIVLGIDLDVVTLETYLQDDWNMLRLKLKLM